MLEAALSMQSLQLVDSTVSTTRFYWRKEWGLTDEIAADPRPLKEILGTWPDWRKPISDDNPLPEAITNRRSA